MAQIVEIDEAEHCPGLYDSANGVSLVAVRVVDITEDCPSGERTVLLYTNTERGPIVQIGHPYPDRKYFGSHIHFFINEIGREATPRDDSFCSTARRAGLDREALRRLIVKNAPEWKAIMQLGCCSAISPCEHQRRDPRSICDVCQKAACATSVPNGERDA